MDTLLTDLVEIRRSTVRSKAVNYAAWAGAILQNSDRHPVLAQPEKESLEQLLQQLRLIGRDSEDPLDLLRRVPDILFGLSLESRHRASL